MYINLCPGAISLRYDNLPDMIREAIDCGFSGVDFIYYLVKTEAELESVISLAVQSGIKWGLFPMPCDFLAVTDSEFDDNLSRLESEILPMAKRAGCLSTYNHIWSGSNDMESADYRRWLIKRINRIVEKTSEAGVLYGLEFLGAQTLQNSFKYPFNRHLEPHLELIAATANPTATGLILDSYHFHTSGETASDLTKIPSDMQIVNVHLNDAPKGVAMEDYSDMNRALPGETGVIPLAEIICFLKVRNYAGPIICEPFYPACERFGEAERTDVLREVSACIRAVIE